MMTEQWRDPYEFPDAPHPVGENSVRFHDDGSVTVEKRAAEVNSIFWKGARKILALPDETIFPIFTRPSGIIDYSVNGAHVSWGHGKDKRGYLCHRHGVNRCAHSKRLERWREEQER